MCLFADKNPWVAYLYEDGEEDDEERGRDEHVLHGHVLLI